MTGGEDLGLTLMVTETATMSAATATPERLIEMYEDGDLEMPADADRSQVQAIALANDNVRRFVGEAQVRKVILRP